MTEKVIVVGCNSDIAKEMVKRLNWEASLYHHDEIPRPEPWDLLLITSGVMHRPLVESVTDNALVPIYTALELLPHAKPYASVCFFAGPNPNKPFPLDIPYSLAKTLLIKACEEYTSLTKWFILGPGYVNTKIHFRPTNRPSSSFDEIYSMLRACMEGTWASGRNIHIKDDWKTASQRVKKDTFKLRRNEDR